MAKGATTGKYPLPYPDEDELVVDGDNMFESLATDADAALTDLFTKWEISAKDLAALRVTVLGDENSHAAQIASVTTTANRAAATATRTETGLKNAQADHAKALQDAAEALTKAGTALAASTSADTNSAAASAASQSALTDAAKALAHINGSNPVGSVIAYAGTSTVPDHWALCDGDKYDPATWPDLFTAIKNTYGGTPTEPLLPNLKGKVIAGVDGSAEFTSPGKTFGEKKHQLTKDEMPAHDHTIEHDHNVTLIGGTHHHSIKDAAGPGAKAWSLSMDERASSSYDTATKPGGGGHSHTGTTNGIRPNSFPGNGSGTKGGSQSHNNIQPSFALNYIIRVELG